MGENVIVVTIEPLVHLAFGDPGVVIVVSLLAVDHEISQTTSMVRMEEVGADTL